MGSTVVVGAESSPAMRWNSRSVATLASSRVSYPTTVSKRIRQGELDKIFYLAVVGDEEEKQNAVNVRTRRSEQQLLAIKEFTAKLEKEIAERT